MGELLYALAGLTDTCFGVDLTEDEELLDMISDDLWDREEVIEVAFDMETPAFDMLYGLDYCGLYDEDSIREELCPEQENREINDESLLDEQCKINPAKGLPAGWCWHEYADGGGSLCSPKGQSYYIYDLSPYHSQGGIEYKKNEADLYGVFFGSFEEFKSYAEEEMRMVLSVTPQGNTAQFGLGM